MKRTLCFLAFFVIFFAPVSLFAGAGIPGGGIWFSKEPFFAGDTINIYTVVFNSSAETIKGELEFFDIDNLIGRKEVSLSPGENKTISYETTVAEGKHAFRVRIAGGDFLDTNGDPIKLKDSKSLDAAFVIQTSQILRTVLKDTDNDEIADTVDLDIDGDGLLNEKEKKIGTNVYLADTDGDGLMDSADPRPTVRDSLPDIADKSDIADKQVLSSALEKVLPDSVVEPIVSIATPIVGNIEEFRVSQANRNNARIVNTVDTIIERVGSEYNPLSGTTTDASPEMAGRPSPWSVLWNGVSEANIVKTPFQYVVLFFSLLYHTLVTYVWIFYISFLLIIVKILLIIKRFIFNRGE